jgi:YfiH family protein
MEWRERDGVRWLEAKLDGATAAFSSRLGGISEPPYDSLNVAVKTGDERDRVLTNRRRLAGALEIDPDDVVMARQIHGDRLLRHGERQRPRIFAEGVRSPEEADAHATDVPGLAPLVMVADCLPVALAGPAGVAMAHCGWRGLAADIAGAAAREVRAEHAAIGPGIGPCCYEVGDEVLAAFAQVDGASSGRMLDLVAITRAQLTEAGVEEIEDSGLCTSCEAELFYSHRRDGERTGRQAGLVWLS